MVRRFLLLIPVALVSVLPVQGAGGIIFNRKPNTPAAPSASAPKVEDRTAGYISILRGDKDERRRIAAADMLSRFDLRQHPQAGMALIEALQQDQSERVRIEVAKALGRTRPMTQQVGQALEFAFETDASKNVKIAARNALMPFIQGGYKTGQLAQTTPTPPPAVQPAPPAAPTTAARPAPTGIFGKKPQPGTNAPNVRETAEPPLADPIPSNSRITPPKPSIPSAYTPMATSQPAKPAAKIPPLESKPAAKPAKPDDDGPILLPPE